MRRSLWKLMGLAECWLRNSQALAFASEQHFRSNKEKTNMYLVMGITGKVGGATARHLLKQGKQVRALVRNREKAAKWADLGVELVDGDWNDGTAIVAALKGVEGAFVMLPAVWAPSPDFREARGVIANLVEALTRVVPPRVVALSSTGANRTSGLGMITALSLMEQGFRSLPSPVAFVRAGGFFENFLFGLEAAQGGTLPVFYNPTDRKSMMVASDDIGAEVATLLTGPAWSGHRVIELGSMVSADDQSSLDSLLQLLKTAGDNTSMPSITAPVQILCYFFVQALLGLASAILFLINCSAFILYGVTALFGPIFVPLLMTRTFRAKFFSFLDVLIGFAMIRAVAAAFIFVWSGFMNAFIQQTFNGNYSMEMWLANLIPCTMVFIAFIINMLFIPSMTQAIFGGAAGLTSAATTTVGALVGGAAIKGAGGA
jgi:uncharacterized protein YbjT (DUF2867 family)